MAAGSSGDSPLKKILEQVYEDLAAGIQRPLEEYLASLPEGETPLTREESTRVLSIVQEVCRRTDPTGSQHIASYRLDRLIGSGGQGEVYEAMDARLGRRVAIKVLKASGQGNEQRRIRFRREAELAARLNNRGICQILDFGEEDGVLYLAMEFVEGVTLDRWLRGPNNDPSSWFLGGLASENTDTVSDPDSKDAPAKSESGKTVKSDDLSGVCQMMEKIARALHEAHEHSVIHRDIKPQNIMIRKDGHPVIMDFGLAGDLTADGAITNVGELFGSVYYMSPEQLTRHSIRLDRRTDVWSLGVVLYEAVCGGRPFDGGTREHTYQSILAKEPPNPRLARPSIPKDLVTIMEVALQKDRDRRYATAQDLADDLARLLKREPIVAKRPNLLVRTLLWIERYPWKAASLLLALILAASSGFIASYVLSTRADLALAERVRKDESLRSALIEGYGLLGHAQRQDAIQIFDGILEHDPLHREARVGRLMAFLSDGKATSVINEVKALPGDMQQIQPIRRIQAQAHEARKEVELARQIREALGKPEDALDLFIMGLQAMSRASSPMADRYREAADLFHGAIAASRVPHPLFHFERAHAVGFLEDPALSAQAEHSIRCVFEETHATAYWMAFAFRRVDPERALAGFRRALEIRPTMTLAHFELGRTLQRLGRLPEAEVAYEAATKQGVRSALLWYGLGSVRHDLGNWEKALDAFDRALSCDPKYVPALHGRAAAQRLLRRKPEAQVAYETLMLAGPTDPVIAADCGDFLLREARFEEAEQWVNVALNGDPNHPAARLTLGLLHHYRFDFSLALVELRTALSLGRTDARPWLGWALYGSGQFGAAVDAFEQAIEGRSEAGSGSAISAVLDSARRFRDAGRLVSTLDAENLPEGRERRLSIAVAAAFQGKYALATTLLMSNSDSDVSGLGELTSTFGHGPACWALQAIQASPDRPPAERLLFRNFALNCLSASLTRMQARPHPTDINLAALWRKDPHLADVREESRLSLLEPDERDAWRQFWKGLEAHFISSR